MLQNNLDPEVAERPDDLVVYGGTGRAARSWSAFDAMIRTMESLKPDETMPVHSGKPVAEMCTRSPYPDARRLIDAGVTVALASDCNPGSSYTTSMPLVIALAVINMGMTPDEALWSATAGGAAALRRSDMGHLGVGACANAVVLDAPSHMFLAYRPGVQLVGAVVRNGALVTGSWPVTA